MKRNDERLSRNLDTDQFELFNLATYAPRR